MAVHDRLHRMCENSATSWIAAYIWLLFTALRGLPNLTELNLELYQTMEDRLESYLDLGTTMREKSYGYYVRVASNDIQDVLHGSTLCSFPTIVEHVSELNLLFQNQLPTTYHTEIYHNTYELRIICNIIEIAVA
jgi:hypothetical protein